MSREIVEVAERTPQLIDRLLEVWEHSVRATHLFLSDSEIMEIKAYVPQALREVPHLVVAWSEDGLPTAFMALTAKSWRCFSWPRRSAGKGWARSSFSMV